MTERSKPKKWKVRNVNHHYGKEFKFDDYIDKQIKILATKMNSGEHILEKAKGENNK